MQELNFGNANSMPSDIQKAQRGLVKFGGRKRTFSINESSLKSSRKPFSR